MLERILKLLENGPVKVRLTLHGPTVQVGKDVEIVAADQVGIVARVKGGIFSDGGERLFPWTAVSIVDPL